MKIAIIFASGIGKRLQPLTNDMHKSLVLINDLPLIEHLINNLFAAPDLKKIIIVTGYRHNDFLYLTKKYSNLSLTFNSHYLPYESSHALTLVKQYFTKENDILIVSGDFVMKENCFLEPIEANVMAALKRENNKKSDWSYELDDNGNIIDIIKTDDQDSLLASEWSYITSEWAQLIGEELDNRTIRHQLTNMMIGKYLINNSIAHNIALKPYVLDYNKFWDLDTKKDLARIKKSFNS